MPYPEPMASVTIRGVELAHELIGPVDAPAFVWGHGLTSSRAGEDEFALVDTRRLGSGQARVLRYDARGHGTSGLTTDPAGYSWAELARDQLALVDQVGIDRFVAGGASMGAATALYTALLAPDRVEALVLVIPPTGWELRAAQVAQYEQMASIVERVGVEPIIAASSAMPPPDPFVGLDEWSEGRAAALRAADPERLAMVFRGAGHADLPPPEDVATIDVPVLILAWTGDPGHPVASAERLAELLPGAAGCPPVLASTWDELCTWTDRCADFLGGLTRSEQP